MKQLPFGPRSHLALAALKTLVLGVWQVDRTWDEKGSRAYERAAKEAGKRKVVIPPKELDAAFPFPWAFLIGWGACALANLYPLDGSSEVAITTEGIVAAVASLALSIIASVPMGNAVRDRNASAKAKLGMSFVITWIILTCATVQSNPQVSPLYCPFGMISIIASMKILRKHRKMGDSWEQDGVPNPNPVVYNMGGPLFVFGWFLFWLGVAGTTSEEDAERSGLPIYYNLRTLWCRGVAWCLLSCSSIMPTTRVQST